MPTGSELAEARAELETLGVRVHAAPLDVTSDESVESFFADAVAVFGRIDILVNAAGTWGNQPMAGHPDGFWHRLIEVNLNGRTAPRSAYFPE